MLSELALDVLSQHSKYGTPLKNHCERLAEFTIELARQRDVSLDTDLLYAACYLHDIGLCIEDTEETNYLKRGQKFAQTLGKKWKLTTEQQQVLDDIMLYSHSLRHVPQISAQGELIRLAVQTEHSIGRIKNGLSPIFIRSVFKKYPRKGFNRVLLSFFRIAVIHDGPGELVHIFFPQKQK